MSSRGRILLLPLLTLFASLVVEPGGLRDQHVHELLRYRASASRTSRRRRASATPSCRRPAPEPAASALRRAPATQLLFFPTNFVAQASGAGGYDETGRAAPDADHGDGAGREDRSDLPQRVRRRDADRACERGGTGVFAGMSGFVTVLEVNGVSVTPTVISFNAGGVNPSGVTGAFTPGALGSSGLDRNGIPGHHDLERQGRRSTSQRSFRTRPRSSSPSTTISTRTRSSRGTRRRSRRRSSTARRSSSA